MNENDLLKRAKADAQIFAGTPVGAVLLDLIALVQRLNKHKRNAARYEYLRARSDAGGTVGVWREQDGVPIDREWLCGKELDVAVDRDIKEM